MTFDQAFNDRGEPAALHYQAVYVSDGSEHHLEVWREGGGRLKRRTDASVEVYAFRKPGEAEVHMSILDLKRRIHTRIDRTNLYRVGNFTDWFDLAHGLKHPKGEYRLTTGRAPGGPVKALAGCRWYDLTREQRITHICWSERDRIPLLIQAQDGKLSWRVLASDRKPIPANTFVVHDEGFVKNDANEDIEGD